MSSADWLLVVVCVAAGVLFVVGCFVSDWAKLQTCPKCQLVNNWTKQEGQRTRTCDGCGHKQFKRLVAVPGPAEPEFVWRYVDDV